MKSIEHLVASAERSGLDVVLPAEDGLGDHPQSDLIRQAQHAAGVWVAATGDDRVDIAEDALELLHALLAHADESRRVMSDHILLVPGAESLPWARIIPPARGLALLYNFSPFQDTGSTVASKRLRNFGESVDVIAASFLHHKKADPTIERISAPYVSSKYFIPGAPAWAHWPSHAAFATRAADLAERYMSLRDDPYDFLYTRAMWSPSLLAGALTKLRHSDLYWVAEFSDPLSLDVMGVHRGGTVLDDACSRILIEAFEATYGPMSERERTIFALAETLVFAFADEIIFTNSLQMETMLEVVERPELRERIEAVATVAHHPTLPRPFYQMSNASGLDDLADPQALNIAYFGEFYASRGLTEVTSAIRALPDRLRERTRLHVFTNYVPPTEGGRRPRNFSAAQYDALVARAVDGVGARGIEHLVRFHPSLPFLDFLSATDAFDLLVVRDAATADHHHVNPFLPSKWSDYAGSVARTWAIVENGSTMSGMDPAYSSPLNDVTSAREVLWSALDEKFSDNAVQAEGGLR